MLTPSISNVLSFTVIFLLICVVADSTFSRPLHSPITLGAPPFRPVRSHGSYSIHTTQREERLPEGDKRGSRLSYPVKNCSSCNASSDCCRTFFGRRTLFRIKNDGAPVRIRETNTPIIVRSRLGFEGDNCTSDFNTRSNGVFVRRDSDRIFYLSCPTGGFFFEFTEGWHPFPTTHDGVRCDYRVLSSVGLCASGSIMVEVQTCADKGIIGRLSSSRCFGFTELVILLLLGSGILSGLAGIALKCKHLCCGQSLRVVLQNLSSFKPRRSGLEVKDEDDIAYYEPVETSLRAPTYKKRCLWFPWFCVAAMIVSSDSCVRPVTVSGSQMSCINTLDHYECSAEFSILAKIREIGGSYCAVIDYGQTSEVFSITLIDVLDVYKLVYEYHTGTWFPFLESSKHCSGTSGCDYSSCKYDIAWGQPSSCERSELENRSSLLCQSECRSVDCVLDCMSAKCCTQAFAFPVSSPDVSVSKLVLDHREVKLMVNGSLVTFTQGSILSGNIIVLATDTGGIAPQLPFTHICQDGSITYLCDACDARNPQKLKIGDVQFNSNGKMTHMAQNLVNYYWPGKRPQLSDNYPGWDNGIKYKLPFKTTRAQLDRIDSTHYGYHHLYLDSSVEFSIISQEDYKISYVRKPVIPQIRDVYGAGYLDSAVGPMGCMSVAAESDGGSCTAEIDGKVTLISLTKEFKEYCLEANGTIKDHTVCVNCEFGAKCSSFRKVYELQDLTQDDSNLTKSTGFHILNLSTSLSALITTIITLIVVIIIVFAAVSIMKTVLTKMKAQ